MKLKRIVIFQEVLREVQNLGNQYGISSNEQHFLQDCYLIYPVIDTSFLGSRSSCHICSETSIIQDITLSCKDESEQKTMDGDSELLSDIKSCTCSNYLSIENGRTLIIARLIWNLIQASGRHSCTVMPCMYELEVCYNFL